MKTTVTKRTVAIGAADKFDAWDVNTEKENHDSK